MLNHNTGEVCLWAVKASAWNTAAHKATVMMDTRGWTSIYKTVKSLNNISQEEFNALYEIITYYGYAELEDHYETA